MTQRDMTDGSDIPEDELPDGEVFHSKQNIRVDERKGSVHRSRKECRPRMSLHRAFSCVQPAFASIKDAVYSYWWPDKVLDAGEHQQHVPRKRREE